MIGDVLTSSILIEAIKKRYPDSEVFYLIDSKTRAVIENNPHIDRLILVTKGLESNKWRFFKFLRSLRKHRFDVVIDIYSKLSTNLMSYFSGAELRASKHKWYTAFLYSHPIKYLTKPQTQAGLAIENRMQFLNLIDAHPGVSLRPKIYLTKAERDQAANRLEQYGIDPQKPLIMVGLLGSSVDKSYPYQYMAQMLDHLGTWDNMQLLFNYIPNQEKEARMIFNACRDNTQKKISFELYGKSLREFMALTSYCTALIGNEGGAVNMAKALGVPTFTIFSPWIKPEDWAVFDDGDRHVSVHLRSYHAEPYKEVSIYKKLRKQTPQLYEQFHFDLFKPELDAFMQRLLS